MSNTINSKQRSFLYILVILSTTLPCSMQAYSQSNIDSLWSILHRSQPIQENSPVWQLAGKQEIKEICISGDCTSGYGMSILTDRVYGRCQYEGSFLRSKHHGVGIIKMADSSVKVCNFENGKEIGAYLLKNNGLMELHNVKGHQKATAESGFSLHDVQKHQANSFEKFTPCTCLGRATHVVVEEYQQPVDLTDELKTFRGTGYRTETRRVEYPGLKNNCNYPIYIKAITNHGGFYFDASLVVLPGLTIRKLPFNATYADVKEDLQYLGQYREARVQDQ